jgi:hypothetical protein
MTTRAAARRMAHLREAGDALAILPGPGEAIHAILTGRFDLMRVIIKLMVQLGHVDVLRIATLAYSTRNLTELMRLLDSKAVHTLTLLCSKFFAEHNGDVWESTLEQLRERGQRAAAAARSHGKVVAFAFASGRRLTLEGSANLRSNGNREQLTLIDGAPLHDWHAAWIDAAMAAHEGEDEER